MIDLATTNPDNSDNRRSAGHAPKETLGQMMRDWRRRRRVSQLELSLNANVSTRHLSFVESGRSQPSRELLSRLGECLAMPLRERNRLMLAGGYSPAFPERDLDDPDMAEIRNAVRLVLDGHAPYPALAVDRRWNLIEANAAGSALFDNVPPRLATTPFNVLRFALDPEGLAPMIVNFAECRHHLLGRLQADAAACGDPSLTRLHDELSALPFTRSNTPLPKVDRIAVPLQLRQLDGSILSFISTTTVFGSATDVTLAELTLESFFPADESTRQHFLRQGRQA